METVQHKNLKLMLWDLGGQTNIRPYWRCYYQSTNAIIYVVDSADADRLGVAKEELIAMLEEEELQGVPIAVFANKTDLPGVLSTDKIAEGLGLTLIKDRAYQIFSTSAVKGTGIEQGLDWVAEQLQQ